MKRSEFIENIRSRLIQRRAQLLEDVTGSEGVLNSLCAKSEPGDTADQATDSIADELGFQLAGVELRELAKIEQALVSIDSGTYGICVGCQKNIPMNRLDAVPDASSCINCKRLAEEQGIEVGSATDWAAIFGHSDANPAENAPVS